MSEGNRGKKGVRGNEALDEKVFFYGRKFQLLTTREEEEKEKIVYSAFFHHNSSSKELIYSLYQDGIVYLPFFPLYISFRLIKIM